MNKRQKIIVSITGITLVLLILVGLTYAYFLTRIQGNTNTKSISVTTADLRIVYADGNQNIITKEKIIPGTVIGEKDFTVTNEGNSESDYIVVIDDVIIKNLSNNSNTTFNSNDFVYTLTCVQKNKNTNEVSGTCESVTSETSLPLVNNGLLISNSIPENMRHEYSLIVTYKETNVDQSADMNKKLEAKVDIKDIKTINPYSSNQNSLAYNIINNSIKKTNGTELRAVPLTVVAKERSLGAETTGRTYGDGSRIDRYTNTQLAGEYWLIYDLNNMAAFNTAVQTYAGSGNAAVLAPYLTNNCNDTIGKYVVIADSLSSYDSYYITECQSGSPVVGSEKELSVTTDDYGTSYYYRGHVEDNYVNFANKCWRIVRIEGDGSIKLVLEDNTHTCNNGYTGNWSLAYPNEDQAIFGRDATTYSNRIVLDFLNHPAIEAAGHYALATALQNFQTSLGSANTNKLNSGNWCYSDKAYADESGNTPVADPSTYYSNGTNLYFDDYVRLYGGSSNTTNFSPTLKCTGSKLNKYADNTDMIVGSLTADEVAFAGGTTKDGNYNYYLTNDFQLTYRATYSNENDIWDLWYFVLGKSRFVNSTEHSSIVRSNGRIVEADNEDVTWSPRPAVSLKSGTTISGGTGTKENPYVIN